MEFYLVRPGDTLYHIADQYHVSMAQLIQDNAIRHPEQLVVGQTLVIRCPERIHRVRAGEDLRTIAAEENLSLGTLLRQNLNLLGRERIIPGQSLVLRYEESRLRRPLALLGRVPPKERQEVRPFLTAPLSTPYLVTPHGILVPPVHPSVVYDGQYDENRELVTVQDLTSQGTYSRQLVHKLLNDPQAIQTFINELTAVLDKTDSQGASLSFVHVDHEDAHAYVQFIERLRCCLSNNMTLVVALPAGEFGAKPDARFLCGQIAQVADLVLVVWDTLYHPAPGPLSSITELEATLQQVLAQVSPEKCILELSDTGCDWTLPYQPDTLPAFLSPPEATALAWKHHAAIRRCRSSEEPWFRCTDDFGREHQVYFQDAASLLPQLDLVEEYNLYGLSFPRTEQPSVETLSLLDSRFCIREALK